MDTEPSSAAWNQQLARLGIACWVAFAFLSYSSRLSENFLTALGLLGAVLLLFGFLSWRRAWMRGVKIAPLRTQVLMFARPLVGLLMVIGGVTLTGAAISGDQVSLIHLNLAGLFLVVGVLMLRNTWFVVPDTDQHRSA